MTLRSYKKICNDTSKLTLSGTDPLGLASEADSLVIPSGLHAEVPQHRDVGLIVVGAEPSEADDLAFEIPSPS